MMKITKWLRWEQPSNSHWSHCHTYRESFDQGWKCALANCLFDQNLGGFDVQDSPSFTSQCKLCKLSHCCDNQCAHYCTGHQNFSPLCVSNVSTVTMKYCTPLQHTLCWPSKQLPLTHQQAGPILQILQSQANTQLIFVKVKIPRLKLD